MPSRPRKKISISIIVPFLVFMLFFSILFWQKYRASHDVPVTPTPQHTDGNRTVTLFFGGDGSKLVREAREIEFCNDDNACLKSTIDELLNGPVGEYEETLPEGTVVESLKIEGNLATIGLNRIFSVALPSGSNAEMMAVYSIVNTTAFNFPQINIVKLNVDGDTATVLRHLDLSVPLVPDYSLEHSPLPEDNKKSQSMSLKRKGSLP